MSLVFAPGAGSTPATKSHWLRGAIWAVGAVLLVLLSLVAVEVGSFVFEPNGYAGTSSIETRSDYRNPTLMERAWAMPGAKLYKAHPFEYQRNQSFCGPAAIANVAHSLRIALRQNDVMKGTAHEPVFGFLLGGLTLDQVADLLRLRTHRPVQVVRGLDLAAFRATIATVNDPAVRIVANFHRGPLFGRGHGHHSPLLAYLADHDLVLVADVNPNYRPFLVSTAKLWQAVNTADDATHLKRGLLILTASTGGERR